MKFDFFNQLKQIFSTPDATVSTDANVTADFADAKTDKGDILKITPSVKEGATVEVVSEDGTTAPATAGDHVLADGSTISVDEKGAITKIVAKVEQADANSTVVPDANVTAELADANKPADAPAADAQGSDVDARVGQLEEAVQMIVDWIKSQKEEMSAVKEAEAKLASEEEVKLKAELEAKNKELSTIKVELRKIKAAPSLSFKAAAPVENKNLNKVPLSDMQKRLQGLKGE